MPMSEELKAKMRAGRERAAAAKRLEKATATKPAAPASQKAAPAEFLGITKTECCIGCTAECCVISGVGLCAHPAKGALQPALMMKQEVVDRHNRARKHLAHVELDRRP